MQRSSSSEAATSIKLLSSFASSSSLSVILGASNKFSVPEGHRIISSVHAKVFYHYDKPFFF